MLDFMKTRPMRARVAVLLALAALAVGAVVGPDRLGVGFAAVAAGLMAVAPTRMHEAGSRSVARLVALVLAASMLGGPWQLTMALALGSFVLIDRSARGELRQTGRVPVVATLVVGGITPLALCAWLWIAQPDLGDVLEGYVPDVPWSLLVAGAVAFVVVNAVLEEWIWRGVLQARLASVFGMGPAIALQAASFGLQHAHGVPRGVLGVAMVCVWGLMLGWLRHRSGGLLAPVLAHAVADATIAVIVLEKLTE
jgi:uncharacterized protein